MIRWLQGNLSADFREEFRAIGEEIDSDQLREEINPALTFKFLDISPETVRNLEEIASSLGLFFRSGIRNSRGEMIVSFPHWNSVRSFIPPHISVLSEIKIELDEIYRNVNRTHWMYQLSRGQLLVDRPLIMGILNVTPDSFSDGGRFFSPEAAYRHAAEMVEAGADILDVGAESTRPGAKAVDAEEEWRRLQPVLQKITRHLKVTISVDTYKAETARRAIAEGADIINDISGLSFDPQMAEVVAQANVPVILMHIKGTPRNMQKNPRYQNLMEELYYFMYRQIQYANQRGISRIIIDPGIGFGKRLEDNFEIIRRLREFSVFGHPILLGPSRKSFIGLELDLPPEERLMGTSAAVAIGIWNGAKILRVHDVAEMHQVTRITQAILERKA